MNNNDRIVNLILSVKYKGDTEFEAVRQKFQRFRETVLKTLGAANIALALWNEKWMKLNTTVMTVVFSLGLLAQAMKPLGRFMHSLGQGYLSLLKWGIAFAFFRKSFQDGINKMVEWIKHLAEEMMRTFKRPQHEIDRMKAGLDKLKNADPFISLGRSVKKYGDALKQAGADQRKLGQDAIMKSGGAQGVGQFLGGVGKQGLGSVISGAGALLANPALAAALFAVVGIIDLIVKGFVLAFEAAVKWVEFTINGLKTIIELGVKVGVVLAASFHQAAQSAVSLHNEYEKVQRQLEFTIQQSTLAGTRIIGSNGKEIGVAEAAREEVEEIKKLVKEFPTLSESETLAGIVETKILGTEGLFKNAGKNKKDLMQLGADMAAAFGGSFEENLNLLNQAALGRFVALTRRTGITRAEASEAGRGDTVAGMFKLLEQQTAGAAKKMENTFEGAMEAIGKRWRAEFAEFTKPIFDNIRELAIGARDMLISVFKSNEWKAAKTVLKEIFNSWTQFAKTGVLNNAKILIQAMVNFINAPSTKQNFQRIGGSVKVLIDHISVLGVQLIEFAQKWLPPIMRMFEEITVIATVLFIMISKRLPAIIKLVQDFGDRFIKVWFAVGNVVMNFFIGVMQAADLAIRPIQGIMASFATLMKENPLLFKLLFGASATAIFGAPGMIMAGLVGSMDNEKIKDMGESMLTINQALDDTRDFAYKAAGGFRDMFAAISQGKNPSEVMGKFMENFDMADEFKRTYNEVKRATVGVQELKKEVDEIAEEDKAKGKLVPYEPETIKAMIDFYNEIGQHQKGVNILQREYRNLLKAAKEDLKAAADLVGKNWKQNFKDINANTQDLLNKFRTFFETVVKVVDQFAKMNQQGKRVSDSVFAVLDAIEGPMDRFFENAVRNREAVIQHEKALAEMKIQAGKLTGNYEMLVQGAEEYNQKLVEEIELREKAREKLFTYRKDGMDAITSLIEAQKGLATAFFSDMGPGADFQAQRQLAQDQLELLKAKLALQQEELKTLEEKQKLEGGATKEIIEQNAAIITTKAEMMNIEKTLKNITKPTLLEQIVGAPQRVLSLLPTAQQLQGKAKTAIKEQLGNINRGALGGGAYTIFQIPQQMFGGPLGAATAGVGGGGVPSHLLGTPFFPSHVAGEKIPGGGLDIKKLLEDIKNDRSKLAKDIKNPETPAPDIGVMKEFNKVLSEFSKVLPELMGRIYQLKFSPTPNAAPLGGPTKNPADSKVGVNTQPANKLANDAAKQRANDTQISNINVAPTTSDNTVAKMSNTFNLNATVNVQVNDFEKEWDKIQPKLKQEIIRQYRVLRADEKNRLQ